ncbi:MAG TPA: acyl-CoA dehydrogenase family protein [Mycobacteriales bacterium]|nr:acyl-CoA dehydrogenase family protein [Mycobacteriales bacterium]
MNGDLGADAVGFGRVVRDALASAGGDELAITAEAEPAKRGALIAPVLGELGVWDLRPREDSEEAEAAAAACRSAGWWGLPYPVAERLAKPSDLDADGLVVVADVRPTALAAGLDDLRWAAVALDGRRFTTTVLPMTDTVRKIGFAAPLALAELDAQGDGDLALALVLPIWTLLGMLDRAMALTLQHVRDREQFGQPLAAFQGVQFQLTDAEVERAGLEELAKHALWTAQTAQPGAVDDALALRLAAVEAADVVFRITHQLHGAVGFCDETTLSWISRSSQPLRRIPFGLSGTRDALTRRITTRGLSGLFGPRP